MKTYRRLVKVIRTSGETQKSEQKQQKQFYAAMGIMAVLFILLPCSLLVGFFSYAMTLSLSGGMQGMLLVVHFLAAFSMIFGMQVILNEFYFSGDLEYLIPLPIPSYKIAAAKFTVAYWNESVMQMLILFSAFLGFLLAASKPVWYYLFSFVGLLTLPLMPLLYCAVICLVLMRFTKMMKNKDNARKLSMIVTVVLMIAGTFSLGLLKTVSLEHFTEQLSQGEIPFMNIMNIVFLTNYMLSKAIAEGSAAWFIGYFAVNIAGILLFLLLADRIYIKGLCGVNSAGRKREKKRIIHRQEKAHSPFYSYLCKEWRILYRTPAYLMNCILVHLIWPALLVVIYMMQKDNHAFQEYYIHYMLGNEGIRWLTTLIVGIFALLVTAANSIASTGITREGKQFAFMKQIPLSYETQLNVKAIMSILISGFFVVCYIILFSVCLGVDNKTSWYYILISLLEIIFVTYFGLYLDTINPKLLWEDELNALRGNVNIFFNMAYAMMIGAMFAIVMYLFYHFTKIPLGIMQGLLLVVLVIADVFMYTYCIRKGKRNIENRIG